MMDAADDSATLDMESADLEAAASYQANGKMTRSLITEAARAVEKKYFGQTKQQLKSLMYLGCEHFPAVCGCCWESHFFFALRAGLRLS